MRTPGPVMPALEWPLSCDTGSIRLSAVTQTIGEVVELYAGGMNAWSQAATYLPVTVTMRVDCKPLGIQTMRVNSLGDARERVQYTPSIVPGDVADLRVLAMLREGGRGLPCITSMPTLFWHGKGARS